MILYRMYGTYSVMGLIVKAMINENEKFIKIFLFGLLILLLLLIINMLHDYELLLLLLRIY